MANRRQHSDKPESVPLSLPRVYVSAIERLATMDGHGNRSAIVRKLVDREAREQLGVNWLETERAALIESGAAA